MTKMIYHVFSYDKEKLRSDDFMKNAISPLVLSKSWYYMLLL